MILNLKCKNCGFEFMVAVPNNETEEKLKDIKTCPCGCLMIDRNSGDKK